MARRCRDSGRRTGLGEGLLLGAVCVVGAGVQTQCARSPPHRRDRPSGKWCRRGLDGLVLVVKLFCRRRFFILFVYSVSDSLLLAVTTGESERCP